MRKLSKRGKSEASDSESENNGVASAIARDMDESSNEGRSETSDSPQTPMTKRSTNKTAGRKRTVRSRNKQNDPADGKEENGADDVKAEDVDDVTGNDDENDNVSKPTSGKKRKKNDKKLEREGSQEQAQENDENEEYEVEKIIDQRTIKGRRQFLIRWKGYGQDSDTWEQEKDLNCQQLIDDFLAEKEEDEEEEILEKSNSKAKGKQAKGKTNSKKNKKEVKETEESNGDSNKEYEVEKIIDVHFKKNKNREFLIRWKGFSANDDTWEPEEHLNCPDLIAKFMDKLQKVKSTDPRELRANPVHTKRYVTQVHGKRHSRRHSDKQRVTYHLCDD